LLKAINKRSSKGKDFLKLKEEKDALIFINKFHEKIIEKWINFFILKKPVKVSKITRKLK
jgi:hypothetical protein